MGLPKQVEEAAELAEKLHERMFDENTPESGEAENDGEAPQEDTSEQNEQAQEQESYEDLKERLRKAEARYDSLRGKYDNEVPRYQHELNELKQSIIDRLGQSNLQQQVKEEPKEVASNPVLEKFKEEYGEELLEAIKAITRSEVDPLLQEKVRPFQEQVASVEETQITAARNNFVNYLNNNVKGDWQAAWSGQDEKFMEFLQKPDPSGYYTYGQLAQMYNDNWDGERLAKLFNDYLGAPAQETLVTQKQPDPAQTAMVAPSRTNTHSTPNASDKTIWTNATIAQFQKEDRAGKYDSETSQAMWNDLLAAMSEGRIKN